MYLIIYHACLKHNVCIINQSRLIGQCFTNVEMCSPEIEHIWVLSYKQKKKPINFHHFFHKIFVHSAAVILELL